MSNKVQTAGMQSGSVSFGQIVASLFARLKPRRVIPNLTEAGAALLTALLLTLAFPDFDLWFAAWFAFIPLLIAVINARRAAKSFLLGWLSGTGFFFASCWWLTYSSIHYGGLPAPLAYLLLLVIAAIVGVFPAGAMLIISQCAKRWGATAVLLAAPVWTTFEWLRFVSTNQLWNAVGYSQSYNPVLIQAASFGGVYMVSFLVVAFNAAFALLFVSKFQNIKLAGSIIACVFITIIASWLAAPETFDPNATLENDIQTSSNVASRQASPDSGQVGSPPAFTQVSPAHINADTRAVLISIQPNVSIDFKRSPSEFARLTENHFEMSRRAVQLFEAAAANSNAVSSNAVSNLALSSNVPRVVVFPESPMNFTYGNSAEFRKTISNFARSMNSAVLFNSQEPDRRGGVFNSAVVVNRFGNYVAQYDKIQLLPFGEYVPTWLPAQDSINSMVGTFTRGVDYSLLPVGNARGGVFICFESAFPEIARNMTRAGADVLINISNDAYLGDTPVARQHLTQAIFRAVENRRPVIRSTNTGISAYITARGELVAPTQTFVPAVQTWLVQATDKRLSIYTRFSDWFIVVTLFVTLFALFKSLFRR